MKGGESITPALLGAGRLILERFCTIIFSFRAAKPVMIVVVMVEDKVEMEVSSIGCQVSARVRWVGARSEVFSWREVVSGRGERSW